MLDLFLDLMLDRHFLSETHLAKSNTSSYSVSEKKNETSSQKNLLVDSILNGELKTAESSIRSGYNVNSEDESGRTPLMAAAQTGSLEIANLLLKKNAKVDVVDKSGMSALFYAVINSRYEMVEFLITNNANFNLKNSKEESLLILGDTER